MSTDYRIRFAPDRAPATADWNDAIRQAGFDLSLDPTCDIREQCGYWPCVYCDDEAGFEFSGGVVDPEEEARMMMELEGLEAEMDGRDFHASFSANSEEEIACAAIAAAILAELTDGLVFESLSGEEINADQARAWARKSTTNVSPEDQRAKFLATRLAKKVEPKRRMAYPNELF